MNLDLQIEKILVVKVHVPTKYIGTQIICKCLTIWWEYVHICKDKSISLYSYVHASQQ